MKGKKKLSIILSISLLAILAVTLVFGGCARQAPTTPTPTQTPAAPQYQWNAAIVVPESLSYGKALRVFVDLVEARTDGRVIITPYFAGALGGERETFEAVKLGDIEITFQDIYGAYGDVRFDLTNYPRLVGSPLEMQDMTVPRDSEVNQLFKKWLNDDHGLYMMQMWGGYVRDILTVGKPINTLADLQGVKLRIPETPLWLDFFSRIGVVATPIAYPEVYSAMQTGVIDGHEGPAAGYIGIRTAEIGKYYVSTAHAGQTYKMLMALDMWNSLPQDIRDVLDKAAWEQAAFLVGELRYEDLAAKQVLADDFGVQFTELPDSDLVRLDQVALDMLADWEAKLGPDSTRIIRDTLGARIQ